MSLFSKKEAYLGIDIGAHGIKLVELHKKKNRPQLWTYGVVDEQLDIHVDALEDKKPEDLIKQGSSYVAEQKRKKKKRKQEEQSRQLSERNKTQVKKYAELLKFLLEKARITTRTATASLPVSQVFHAIVTLPVVDKKQIGNMVRAEVTKMLPLPIEQMQVAHQLVPVPEGKNAKYIKVLVTAAPKSLVAFYTAIFSEAGIQLQELETEAFALERALVGHDKATAMIVDIGAERTNFFIIDQGLPVTHRSIQIGGVSFDSIFSQTLGLDDYVVQQVKRDVSRLPDVPSAAFSAVIDAIVKEIEYSFDLYLHQIGNEQKRPEKIILTGGSSLIPDVQARIKKKFPLKVFVGDPWARVVHQQGLKSILDAIGPRMGVSIGLALRNILPGKTP